MGMKPHPRKHSVLEDPELWVVLFTELAPKKPRSLMKPESYRETLISIRASIL